MIRTAVFSDIGDRKCNEDSMLLVQKGKWICAAIADGLGGHGSGDRAASLAMEVIKSCFLLSSEISPKELSQWVEKANQAVLNLQTHGCRMQTTIAVLCMNSEKAFWIHAGDSRLYYFKKKRLVFMTKDHSASQLAVQQKEIKAKEIRNHGSRNILLKALGAEAQSGAQMSDSYNITRGSHIFLLCTDGFWENVLETQMSEALKISSNPQEWLDTMLQFHQSKRKKEQDNFTALGIWKDMPEHERGVFFRC